MQRLLARLVPIRPLRLREPYAGYCARCGYHRWDHYAHHGNCPVPATWAALGFFP